MPLAEIKKFRAQYPQYNDIADQPLAQLLVTKYPEYRDLFGDVASGQTGEMQPAFPITGFEGSEADPAAALQFGRRHVLPLALPAAGQLAGAAAGGLVTSPSVAGVPLGVLAGEAAGGALGEAANQALGITEPSAGQIALAGAVPGFARGAVGATRGALRYLGPRLSGAGTALRNYAADVARTLPGMAAPSTPSDALYAAVERFNPSIDLTAVQDSVTKLLKQQAPRAEFGLEVPGGVGRVLRKTGSALEPPEPTVSRLIDPGTMQPFVQEIAQAAEAPTRNFGEIRSIMRGINDKIGSLKAQGGEGFGEMMQLKRAFAESLETSTAEGAGPAFQALKAANMAYRQELAVDTLTDIVSKGLTPLEGRETWSFAAGRTLKALNEAVRKDTFLAESFPEGVLDTVRQRLDVLRQLPVAGAPAGADAGSKLMLGRVVKGAALGEVFAHYALGGMLPPGVAGSVGAVGMLGVADLVSKALLTESGTATLLKVLQPGAGLARPGLAVIAGATRAELATLAGGSAENPVAP